eukprot:TRINITY_DN38191_c0_g1_i1.p1 TRINITY_DN38191_c0_g1~~TRINITY_DN38191_c0_g1_i1.p1  ORF type:complete len:287 (-),score=54.13 TRINITY_DN38191_c0_g1_i1:466-1326(-)
MEYSSMSVPSPSIGMLPEQSEDQLQLGFRIIQNAYNNKVHALEQEVRALKLTLDETKSANAAMQRKTSQLEVELVEGHQKTQQLAEENKEFFKTVQSLRRQLQRLEGLKKKVCESIADHQSNADEDSGVLLREDYLHGMAPLTTQFASGAPLSALGNSGFSRPASRPTSPITRPATATYGGHYSGFAGATFAAQGSSFASPAAPAESRLPPVAQGVDSVVDGKAFFKQARTHLSYEAFNEFLSNIKKLNNGEQTRQQTLDEARRIFGPDLRNLYQEFETLLNRHAM